MLVFFLLFVGPIRLARVLFESISGFAFHSIFQKSDPIRLEPIMLLEIRTPIEHTGEIISTLNVMGVLFIQLAILESMT